jgi:hypothetical protein
MVEVVVAVVVPVLLLALPLVAIRTMEALVLAAMPVVVVVVRLA